MQFKNTKMPKIFIFLLLISSFNIKNIFAENNDTSKVVLDLNFFIDNYYSIDFDKTKPFQKPDFIYNHNQNNQLSINMAMLQIGLSGEVFRTKLDVMFGTYAQFNYAHEPAIFRNIYQAYGGVKLSKNKDLWLDAGIFESHIGFETAISSQNLTLSRSLAAENSPYYLSGLRLVYQPNEKWFLLASLSNGWQVIDRRGDEFHLPAFGHQIQYNINKHILINWSSYIGKESSQFFYRGMRYFNNFYTSIKYKKLELNAGFDIGFQEQNLNNDFKRWLTPLILVRYNFNDKIALATRFEYYEDIGRNIIDDKYRQGNYVVPFQLYGTSLNFDYNINKNVLFRLEGRYFQSVNANLFEYRADRNDNIAFVNFSNENFTLLASLSINFPHKKALK